MPSSSRQGQHPGHLVFQMGDFYELFYDARKAAHCSTSPPQRSASGRQRSIAGVPVRVEGYLARLVALGESVAICRTVSDPALSKASWSAKWCAQ
jgi:DNA mismatch repair protein MutS